MTHHADGRVTIQPVRDVRDIGTCVRCGETAALRGGVVCAWCRWKAEHPEWRPPVA